MQCIKVENTFHWLRLYTLDLSNREKILKKFIIFEKLSEFENDFRMSTKRLSCPHFQMISPLEFDLQTKRRYKLIGLLALVKF